jgi:transcriptional regulator with XRE-family HTH domain
MDDVEENSTDTEEAPAPPPKPKRARRASPGARKAGSSARAATGAAATGQQAVTARSSTRHAGIVDESLQWIEFGRWIAEQREERGLRRRDAARKAKVTESQWRDLETGRKESVGGIRLLPNPSAEVLEGVANALGLPVAEVIAHTAKRPARQPARSGAAGPSRSSGGDLSGVASGASRASGGRLSVKLARLSERDRLIVERLVDAMLAHEQS